MKKQTRKAVKPDVKMPKKLKDMSVDDFMNSFGDVVSDSSSEDDQDQVSEETSKNGHANGVEDEGSYEDDDDDDETDNKKKLGSDGDEISSEEDDDSAEGESDGDSDGSEVDNFGMQHKKSIQNLKKLDPEFYKYLEENDKKLLQFDVSDSEESEGGGKESDDEEGQTYQPPDKLEVNSDESDYEPDGDEEGGSKKKKGVVTLKMIKSWHKSLQSDKSVQTINDVVQAFHAALLRVAPDEERSACAFKVDGGAVFNAIVQLCVLELLPALRKYLNVTQGTLSHTSPVKCKRWVKVKTLVKAYVVDLLELLSGTASVNISTIILKHIHQMTPFIICFPNVTKQFLRKMISLWGTGEETVRVVAFMCILRATTLQQRALLDQTLRLMYMTYVQNTKFVSLNTLPGINFMRRSLTEMFLLDENVSYHHAFLYIRQLAINLRNAITLQKKESTQAVYNWQFVSSLALWIELLGASSKQALQPLLYPIVQVTTGTVKLIPTAQYYPLRFHCVRLLVNLSKNTATFIPILPFLLELLNSYDFNKKHSKVSMKPLDFTCILRVSKTQQQENGFKDALIENIYCLLLEYLANESHSIAFPDLAIPLINQLRGFLKKCKVANYTKKFKQILDKVEENVKYIDSERKTAVLQLSDHKAIEDWETAMKVKGTPLVTFFDSWKKLNTLKQAKVKTDSIDIMEELPKIVKPIKKNKVKSEGPVELFPSDDSDSDGIGFGDDEEEELPKKTRGKRGKKTRSQGVQKRVKVTEELSDDGVDDVVEDMNLSEW